MAEPIGTEPPKVLKWFLLYTLGRLVIAAALIALLWLLGLPGTPGFLFGVLLSMPVSFLLLGRVRSEFTGALVARQERKEALRVQLRGSDADDGGSVGPGSSEEGGPRRSG